MSVVPENSSDGDYQFTLSSQRSEDRPEQSFEATGHTKCSDEALGNAVGLRTHLASNVLHRTCTSDQYESEKNAIYRHALFPLLALLFERCEQATRSPDCVSVAGLKADIQLFVQHQQQLQDEKSSINDDPEVDSLMFRAIQTLRIHLLELEKVNELCRDFCTRYITCLRAKMQNEQLLHLDSFDGECVISGSSVSSRILATGSDRVDGEVLQAGNNEHARRSEDSASSRYQPTNQLSSPIVDRLVRTDMLSGNEDCDSPEMLTSSLSRRADPSLIDPRIMSSMACLNDLDSNDQIGQLSRHAKHVLKSWLVQHFAHPYPTESDKQLLAAQTSLSVMQVDDWLDVARRHLSQQFDNTDDDWKAKRPWCEDDHPGPVHDSVGVLTSGNESIESVGSAFLNPSSAAFGGDFLSIEDHVSMDLKPVLDSRMRSRHEKTDRFSILNDNGHLHESVDYPVKSVGLNIPGNDPNIVSDS